VKAKPRGLRYSSYFAAAALALSLGCAQKPAAPEVSRVQPYGRGYIVSYTDFLGPGPAHDSTIREANRFCEEKGKRMMPDKAEQSGPRTMSLIFRCLSADDPEFR
jgi:hypothetical protein